MANETDRIEEINKKLKDFRDRKFNIIGPLEITVKPDLFMPTLHVELLDTSKGSEDVFIDKDKEGLYGISYHGLKKFKRAAHIEFEQGSTKYEIVDGDIVATAKGSMFALDGTLREEEEKKIISPKNREEEMRAFYRKTTSEKSVKGKHRWSEDKINAEAEKSLKRYMLSLKQNITEKALSGAKARVIKNLLGLKHSYTLEELQQPFVIVSVVPDLGGTKDKDLKMIAAASAIRYRGQLYTTHALKAVHEPTSLDEVTVEESGPKNPAPENDSKHLSSDVFNNLPRVIQNKILSSLLEERNVPPGTVQMELMEDSEIMAAYEGFLKKKCVV